MIRKDLVARLLILPVLFLAASLLGAITSPWWAALLIGFGFAVVFTMVSERLLRQKLMGKIGGSPLSWYTVHLLGETLTVAALTWLSALLGMQLVPGLACTIFAFAIWAYLCQEMLLRLPAILLLWLASRR